MSVKKSVQKIKCPHCETRFQTRTAGEVECPGCGAELRIGGGTRGKKAREAANKSDNKIAIQVTVGLIIAFALIALVISSNKSDEEDTSRRRERRDDPVELGEVNIPASPSQESSIPERHAKTFLLALADQDAETMERLIWWDRMFEAMAQFNNWGEERRYANKDDRGKEKMRQDMLFRILDPDYAELVRTRLADAIRSNAAPPNKSDVGDDWGNVSYVINNLREIPVVGYLIKVQLLDNRDPVADAENPDAWKITRIKQDQFTSIKEGQKPKKGRDIGADLGKVEKKRKPRKRGLQGPAEADPMDVAWLEGTSDAAKSNILDLVKRTQGNDRNALRSRRQMTDLGKQIIPPILTAIHQMNYRDDDAQIQNAWSLVLALRELTGLSFGFGPGTATSAGGPGMAQATPDERARAIRRWFGWWETKGATFTGPELAPDTLDVEEDG